MGQTLSHGVYLPAEGERNCYPGLASNWNLLDTAIGDTAGKASATHTHGNISNDGKVGTTANKPLITGTDGVVQAGSFGNAANTFCEGNDSRLSDARTPVAHTHTKSDVTDLLNSNFIPSANNSYDLGSSSYQWNNVYASAFHGNADTATEFASNQSVTLTGTIEGTASSKAGWTIATNFREGRGGRTTTDFYAKLASGSVSGAWNVYVTSFICNASERFETALVQVCLFVNQQGIVDTTNGVQLRIRSIHGLPKSRFVLVYKNDTNRVLFELYAYSPSANTGILAQLLNEFIRNNNKQSVSIQTHSEIIVNALPDGYTVINAETALTANDFIPLSNNSYDLGSSSYQWNNLYAKNYFYNGTAWGLDKANTWTGENIFNYDLLIKNANATQGTAPSSNKTWTLTFCDSNKATTGQLYCQYRTNGSVYLPLRINNGTYDYRLNFILDAVGYAGFNPSVSGIINLGSSNYKWKTLNGINPGALSLPDLNNGIDISSYITHLDKVVNNYTPSANGWLSIRVKKTSLVHASLMIYQIGGLLSSCETDEFNISGTNLPVIANQNVEIYIYADVLASAKFYPCQGNI